MEKNGQTVCVLDEHDTVIGYTYPKRAKGLVKKCRAEFVSDQVIRLYKHCPTYENMEDREMDKMNYITINPKEWRRNPDGGSKTVCDRFMISNPLAEAVASVTSMVEVLSVGAWDWGSTSHVTNGFQAFEPNTEYHLVFWLNGGENDRSDETCQLQILFTDDNVTASVKEFENGLCYRLNRAYIKPLKKYKGWEYYDIPFTTASARYTQFQFVADRAPMAVMAADEPEVYKDLQDIVDPFEKQRPQRHNIIFEDGWPADNRWYSTDNLVRSDGEHPQQHTTGRGSRSVKSDFFSNMGNSFTDIKESFKEELVEDLQEEILESIKSELDVDALRDEIMESVRDTMENLQDSWESMQDTFESMREAFESMNS